MRSSDQPRQEAGFVASLALMALASLALLWTVSWLARRSVETQLLEQQLATRLEVELPREVQRLYDQARAAGSAPDRRRIEAQALINLHTRGRREMMAVESQRQHMKELVVNRVDARKELSQLGLAVRRAQMWVMLLEQRLRSAPEVRPEPRRTRQPSATDRSVLRIRA